MCFGEYVKQSMPVPLYQHCMQLPEKLKSITLPMRVGCVSIKRKSHEPKAVLCNDVIENQNYAFISDQI